MPILLYLDRRQVERRGDDGHPRRANDTRNRSRNGEDEIIGLGDQSGDHECFRDHPDTPLIDRIENQAFGLLVTMAIRTEDGRVGKEWVSTFSIRWWPYP